MKYKEIRQLNESGLSRAQQMLQEHDGGIITAFRGAEKCGEGNRYSKKDNMKRNLSLRSKIMAAGYGLTSVGGWYVENQGKAEEKAPEKERSFLVIDLKDSGTLRDNLMSWGNLFEQDSVLFLPAGGKGGQLVSTNTCPSGFPGFGKIGVVHPFKNPMFGRSGEVMTKIGNRPFIMGEMAYPPTGSFTKGGWGNLSRKDWRDMPENMLRE